MKLSNGDIFGAKEPLDKLMEIRFPVKVAFGLAKLANKLNVHIRDIESVRAGLIKTYGEVDKDNPRQTRVSPDSENYPQFAKEMDELFGQEVEVVIDKVKLLGEVDGKAILIEPSILMALEKFVEV